MLNYTGWAVSVPGLHWNDSEEKLKKRGDSEWGTRVRDEVGQDCRGGARGRNGSGFGARVKGGGR